MQKNVNVSIYYLAIFCGALGLDRISKWLILHYLPADPFAVFPNLNFVLLWNRGVSFSLFHFDSDHAFWALSACIMLIIALFAAYAYRQHVVHVKTISYEMLVLGGAVSNVIDRFVYGGVLDFIDFYCGSWHFATFNIADACVFVGIVGLILKMYWDSRA